MKTDLLLLHGALGSKDQFLKLSELLDGHFNNYIINFEGHGDVQSEKDFTIELFVSNVLNYIDTNDLEGCDVFGYSMGGYVALKLAKDNPGKLGTIMTLGTKFRWDREIAEKEVQLINPEKIENKVPHFAELLKHRHHPSDWKVVMRKTASMMKDLGDGNAMLLEDFRLIRNKVFITLGSDDKMVSIEESMEVADKFVNGQFILIENLKHGFEEDADKVAGSIIYNLK